MMLKRIELSQKAELEKIFEYENSRSADFCFGNIYMWDSLYEQEIAVIGERLITAFRRNSDIFFAFPVGKGALKPAFDFMEAYCAEKSIPLRISGITEEHRKLMQEEFSGKFIYKKERNYSDYLYEIDALSSYPGKALHAKRNYCNRFESQYKDNWRFEPITKELIPACIAMLDEWLGENADRLSFGIGNEHDALLRGFESFEALGLFGGILFANDKPVGFSVGELISPTCFCAHFEKAFPDIQGAYPMVCREMAKLVKTVYPNAHYVNREDDIGIPELRKSKLSYKPSEILIKYTARASSAEIRPYKPEDIPQLSALWLECFGDEEPLISEFFRLLPEMGDCIVAAMENEIIGMCNALHFSHGTYIYAVGVKEEYRSNGIGAALMDYCKINYVNLCTLPSEDSLYDWYGQTLGTKNLNFCRYEHADAAYGESEITELSCAEYAKLREEILAGTPHASFPAAWYEFQHYICKSCGGGMFRSGNSIVCGYIENGVLQIKEALGNRDFIHCLCSALGVEHARVRIFAENGDNFLAENTEIPLFNLALD